jgi:hypothetical protein
MKAIQILTHLFLPHESNNQKAKILHPSSLLVLSFLLVLFQAVLNLTPRVFPSVLGFAAQISPSEVIRLTNDRRVAAGLAPLSENGVLSQAAQAKGADMLNKGYWAHFAPDGTSPWSFFTSFGYKYRYAGENLARDFSSPGAAVDAWMNSPTHKDNILNGNYKEVGIGVVEGSLGGVDTTIIVQFFGTPSGGTASIPVAKAQDVKTSTSPSVKPKVAAVVTTLAPTLMPTSTPTATPAPTGTPPVSVTAMISPFTSTKNISLAVVGLLIMVLSVDLIVVRRRRIMRIGGRTLAHIAYLGMILAVILILKAGQII